MYLYVGLKTINFANHHQPVVRGPTIYSMHLKNSKPQAVLIYFSPYGLWVVLRTLISTVTAQGVY